MSKDNTTKKRLTLKEQIAELESFGKKYNSDGMHVLREAQMQVNRNWIEQLNKQKSLRVDNPTDVSALVMEMSAAEILRTAHIEGEIHIFEHHRSSPSLFYFIGEQLMLFKDRVNYNLGNKVWEFAREIIRQGNAEQPRLSSMIAFDQSVGDKFKVKLTFCFLLRSRTLIISTTCSSNKNGEFNFSKLQLLSQDLWIFDTKITLSPNNFNSLSRKGKDMSITYWRSPASFEIIQFPTLATHTSKFLPRFTQIDDNHFAVIDGKSVRAVTHLSKGDKTLLNEKEIDTPTALAYHKIHDALLIRTAGKTKQIGIYFPNQPKMPLWRSFGEHALLPLPDRSIRSGVTFTLSCLLHYRPKPVGAYPPPPETKKPSAKSNFLFWFEGTILVVTFKEATTNITDEIRINLKQHLPNPMELNWFQLSFVKNKQEFTIYVNGVATAVAIVPEHFAVEENINLSCPGYMMAELRIWNKVREPKDLIKYSRTWLPSSEFDGLTAYWHLYVKEDKIGLPFESINENNEIGLIQEPDLSGHGMHMTAQASGIRVSGDLNYHTYTADRAPSPFPKFIPLYDLNSDIQTFELDQSTGRIFWSDKNDEGKTVLYTGSALGHSRATILINAEINTYFALLPQAESIYDELIILHAKRRNLIEEQFFGTRETHRDTHNIVEAKHKELDTLLTEKVKARGEVVEAGEDYKASYMNLHQEWQDTIRDSHINEDVKRRELQANRDKALAEAQELIRAAQATVHESRHPKRE